MKIEIITTPKKVMIFKNNKKHEYIGTTAQKLRKWIANDSLKLKEFINNKN